MTEADVGKYRHSGELSDITVEVDGHEFNLHKFPLFVRSNYFKNLKSIQPDANKTAPGIAHVKLENFPGGDKVFSTVADFCYNKEVDVNPNNVVNVRLAAEYLEMTGGKDNCCRGGLAALADQVLFDVLYSAKTKRDHNVPLNLLKAASEHKDHADKSGLSQKLIESYVENLASYVRSHGIYDHNIPIYDQRTNRTNNATLQAAPSDNLHRLAVNDEQLADIKNLPLNSMNDLVKQSAHVGLNPSLISYLVRNYIDYNTGIIKDHYVDTKPKAKPQESGNKPSNLIEIASNILKAEQKLTGQLSQDSSSSEEPKPSNLIAIAGELKEKEKPSELISIANDIREKEAEDKKEAEKNLLHIASELLGREPGSAPAAAAAAGSDSDADEKAAKNLVNIASELLKREPQGAEAEKKPDNLIKIAADFMGPISKLIAAKDNVSDDEKLNVVKTLVNTLNDHKIDPQFDLPWLLSYMNGLDKLKADDELKANFNKLAWNALANENASGKHHGGSHSDLSQIPPSVMAPFVHDIGKNAKDEDLKKLSDLIDRYLADLERENKLDLDTFTKLASAIPKDKRNSFDNLASTLLKLHKKDPSKTQPKQKELLDLIDFSKLNEKTLDEAKDSDLIPAKQVAEAALALCAKLRKELDEANLLLKANEASKRVSLNTSNNRYYDSPSSNFTSSPSAYTSSPSNYHNYPTSKYTSSIRNRSSDRKSNKLTNYPTATSLTTNYSSPSKSYSTRDYNNNHSHNNNYNDNFNTAFSVSSTFHNSHPIELTIEDDLCSSLLNRHSSSHNNGHHHHDNIIIIDDASNDLQETCYSYTYSKIY